MRSLPEHLHADLIGPGVTSFAFRLLHDVIDNNYTTIDSGQRHVFEITRSDGSTRHLHYHKNGSMDPPVCGDIVKAPSNRGVTQPVVIFSPEDASSTVYTQFDLVTTTNQGPYRVGKNEAHVACTRLLGTVPLGSSIDVTNSVGFPWKRFLKTQSVGRNIIGPGLWRVCVVSLVRGPSLAFCSH